MGTTLDFAFKKLLPHLTVDSRLDVLIALVLHANVRNRCWVGLDRIAELATHGNRNKAAQAKRWLHEHGAFSLVPYAQRSEEERALPQRLHVYQLTGRIAVRGVDKIEVYPYLYLSPEQQNEPIQLITVDGMTVNTINGDTINGDTLSISLLSPSTKSPSKKSKDSSFLLEKKKKESTKIPKDKKPRAPHPNEPLRNALVAAFGLDPAHVTRSADTKYWSVAAELKAIDFDPARVPDLYRYVASLASEQEWSGFSVMALAKRRSSSSLTSLFRAKALIR